MDAEPRASARTAREPAPLAGLISAWPGYQLRLERDLQIRHPLVGMDTFTLLLPH